MCVCMCVCVFKEICRKQNFLPIYTLIELHQHGVFKKDNEISATFETSYLQGRKNLDKLFLPVTYTEMSLKEKKYTYIIFKKKLIFGHVSIMNLFLSC